MNDEERIVAIFERKEVDKVPFNIRHEYWYFVNKVQGTLPKEFENLSLADVCEKLGASWRCYSGYYVKSFIKVFHNNVKVTRRMRNNEEIIIIETPKGKLTSVRHKDKWGLSSYPTEHSVKSPRDFKVWEYIFENTKVFFDEKVYQELKKEVRGRGIVSVILPRSPFQALLYNYLGITRTIKFLIRYKKETEEFMEAIKEYNNKFLEVVAKSPVRIINLGENIDVRFTSPKFFQKYCLPYYQEVADYLHKHKKFVHIHVDGFAKPLLQFFRESRLDGIEALTPKPVGDMTLEDIKKALGDELIILDGIPYIFFLPNVNLQKLEDFTRKIVKMFPNNLILGISDELPPYSDVKRVRFVARLLDKLFKK